MTVPATNPEGNARPSPGELWERADGNRERYLALMREHGHLIEGTPKPLPCGWPGPAAATPTTEALPALCPSCGNGYRYGDDGCRHQPTTEASGCPGDPIECNWEAAYWQALEASDKVATAYAEAEAKVRLLEAALAARDAELINAEQRISLQSDMLYRLRANSDRICEWFFHNDYAAIKDDGVTDAALKKLDAQAAELAKLRERIARLTEPPEGCVACSDCGKWTHLGGKAQDDDGGVLCTPCERSYG